ncbi:MAG: hypothetical protein ACFE8B_11840 [Candidatus Hermodarchaeota archaeon]
MSKAISYYDWKLSFQRKIDTKEDEINDNKPVNTLGISDSNFKDFVKNWKEKNLN